MLAPLRPCLAVFAALSLATVSAIAQAGAGFGPWLDPNRDEPAGMKYRTFASKLAGTEIGYLIDLPPGDDAGTARRHPMVYWLHGCGGSQTGAAAFARRLDTAIKAGQAPAAIVGGLNVHKFSVGSMPSTANPRCSSSSSRNSSRTSTPPAFAQENHPHNRPDAA